MSKKKNKAKGKDKGTNPKAQANEAILKYEEMVQDRIVLGLSIGELAEKYSVTRQTVTRNLKEHEERIIEARKELLAERQEILEEAINKDNEEMIKLLGRTTQLMIKMVNKTEKAIDQIKDEDIVKDPSIAFKGLWAATRAAEKVRGSILKQQAQES